MCIVNFTINYKTFLGENFHNLMIFLKTHTHNKNI
jgi:hypothetical protein